MNLTSPFPLKWKVEYQHSGRDCEITSIPKEKRHIICLPTGGDELREIEVIHEYAHAYLCETIHPQFSTNRFKQGTSKGLLQELAPVFRAASDWFADALLMRDFAERERNEITEHVNMMLAAYSSTIKAEMPFEILIGFSLMTAQAKHYSVKGEIPRLSGNGFLMEKAFLSILPEKPTIKKFKKLLNRLLAVFTTRRVRLVQDNNQQVWEIYQEGEKI